MNSLVGNYGGDSGSEDDDPGHAKRLDHVKKPASSLKSGKFSDCLKEKYSFGLVSDYRNSTSL